MPVAISPASHATQSEGLVKRVSVDWTTQNDQNADGKVAVRGTLLKVQFVPGTGGNQPTDQYDVTLTDLAGADVLRGLGANLSNSGVKTIVPLADASDGTNASALPSVVAEDLSLAVRNAGAFKAGSVVIYYR